jgi:hypothetical protein
LIIYDRMFGTFQEEDEDVAYGLVHPSQSFDLIQGQFAHLKYMASRIWYDEVGFWNKWAVIWKGPGWRAGAPRMGFPSDIPELDPAYRKYDPTLPSGFNWYLAANFLCNAAFSVFINLGLMTVPASHIWFVAMFTLSLQSFSMLSDNAPLAPYLEVMRTGISLIVDLLCYLTTEPEKYRIFWYTDPHNYFSAMSPGFVAIRILLLSSFLFMSGYLLERHGLIKRAKRHSVVTSISINNNGSEVVVVKTELSGGESIDLGSPGMIVRSNSPLPKHVQQMSSSPLSRSRKPRGLQVGVALLAGSNL